MGREGRWFNLVCLCMGGPPPPHEIGRGPVSCFFPMESSNLRETRILGCILMASIVLLGLAVWQSGRVLTDLPWPEGDEAGAMELYGR